MAGLWEDGRLRLFICHAHAARRRAGELKTALHEYGAGAFVAHDDISPTSEWEEVIKDALRSCDALIALLSRSFRQSDWTDHEVGCVLGRDQLVISVKLGVTPYGFLGKYQAVPGANRTADQIAASLFRAMLEHPKTAVPLADGLVTQYEESFSFAEARRTFALLTRVPAFDRAQLTRIRDAYRENDQIANSFYVQNRIKGFLKQRGGPKV